MKNVVANLICFAFLTAFVAKSAGITRVYYLAALEDDWNYFPKSTKLTEQQQEYGEKYLGNGTLPLRLGHVYKKAMFREYTDDTYSQKKEREPWLGILGPVLKAEVHDVLEIHVMNKATQPISLHTHGAEYFKDSEGAFYQDNNIDNSGDLILPGSNYTYYWRVPENRGPTESDSNCMIWAYHSHVKSERDIYSGLIGSLLICRQGYLKSLSVNPFYILLFLIFDENMSFYIDENIAKSMKMTDEARTKLKDDEDFQDSNRMYSINGYMYDNLPSIENCLGSQITWYLMALGNEIDIHAVTFGGNTVTVDGHRTDVVHLFPAKFLTASMTAMRAGRWSIKSEVGDHALAGMEATFNIRNCKSKNIEAVPTVQKKFRRYYIAAEEVMWNYAPSSENLMNNLLLSDDSEAAVYFEKGPNRIGGIYKKVVYNEYTDKTFQISKQKSPSLGFLGPTIRVEIGDVLEVTFLNKASRPYSLQSPVLSCFNCKENDTKVTQPGEKRVFQYIISADVGPTDKDPSCITWRYFSDVDSLKDTYSGLNGCLLVCRAESLTEEGQQKDVNQELVLLFAVMDENNSHYFEKNIALNLENSSLEMDSDFEESNLMHSINGLMYGNLILPELCIHDNISWHLMSVGHEVDMHVVHFRGNAFFHLGKYANTIELFPGSHLTVTMDLDNSGKWLLQCRTNDHIKGGMTTWYYVENCNRTVKTSLQAEEKIRDYYIAVIEDEWDYAPRNWHMVTGENLTNNEDSEIYVTRDDVHIGTKYRKALYREYTDYTFQKVKTRKEQEEHLGILGPVIKAEVGEIIRITLFNNASREYNIRPHGLAEMEYNSTHDYADAVLPGHTKTYLWKVLQRSGPSRNGFNCTTWMYYSAVNSVKDTNSGLIGPLIICKPGTLSEDGSRNDIDKEFSVLFTVMDENESWYLDYNIANYCFNPDAVDPDDEDFQESNKKHAINGRLYGSLQGLEVTVGDKVAWYFMGLGTEVDLHTAHFHGLTVIEKNDESNTFGHIEDVVDLFPGITRTVENTFEVPGKWMFHCHVVDHLKAGMMALINVKEKS